MKIKDPEKRLNMFWGQVDRKHVSVMMPFVNGKEILDMGCGYGTTTAQLTAAGHHPIGIDYDKDAIERARKRFPACDFRFANAETLPFPDGTFDVIILRDALHHFFGEADFEKVKSEILRVAKKKARIIFFDPNVNLLLRTMRKLSFHRDEECDFETAKKIMEQLRCNIIHTSFNTLYSLPLSGGYVGINFVPKIGFIQSFILGSERVFERVVRALHLGRHLCWRYMIVGERNTAPEK